MSLDPRRWALDQLGRTIAGHYQVRQLLGAGGMGAVFRAEDLDGGSAVAIKVPLPGRERASLAILHEAEVGAALAGAGVVASLGVFEDEALGPCLVMELLVGEPLSDHLAGHGRLGVDEAVHIGTTVTTTLARVHAEGLVHRDLKPSNVFLTEDGQVVLIDLGIVARIGEEPSTSPPLAPTSRRQVVGTPWYMAPELVGGSMPDAQSDIYALGALLYEMLAGVRPYEALDRDEVLDAIAAGPPSPLGALRADVPPWLERTVERAMARDRGARFASSEALAVALRDGGSPPLRPRRRTTLWWIGGAVLAATSALAGGAAWLGGETARPAHDHDGSTARPLDKRASDAMPPPEPGEIIAVHDGERWLPATVLTVEGARVEALLLYEARVVVASADFVRDPFFEGTVVHSLGASATPPSPSQAIGTIVRRIGDAVLIEHRGTARRWRSLSSVEGVMLAKPPRRSASDASHDVYDIGARVLAASRGPGFGYYPGTVIAIEEDSALRVVLDVNDVVVAEPQHVRALEVPEGARALLVRPDAHGGFTEDVVTVTRRLGHAFLVRIGDGEPFWTSDVYVAIYASSLEP